MAGNEDKCICVPQFYLFIYLFIYYVFIYSFLIQVTTKRLVNMCPKFWENVLTGSDLWTLHQIDMTRAKEYISEPGMIGLKSYIHAFLSFTYSFNILLSL